MDKKLAELSHEVESSLSLGGDLAERVIAELNKVSGDQTIERQHLDSTDKVLTMIYAVQPGWSVSIDGVARLPNGHWRCSLRKSASRDDDPYLGTGRGPTLPHALLAALLESMAYNV
ncbi:MAG TPA: hypothetical protein VLA51_03485 [Paracoccaceae bacterium]|nr:hypothetical protein [Paracoccaceae bacterium]